MFLCLWCKEVQLSLQCFVCLAEVKRRRIESDDEEEEYDEEMEGFITDEGSDIEENYPQDMDYSKHIRQIFGYDKRK